MIDELSNELRDKGQALLDAAYEFWKVHQKLGGPRAVVWLTDSRDHTVIFTRGEYRKQIMANIGPLSNELPLNLDEKDIGDDKHMALEDDISAGFRCGVALQKIREFVQSRVDRLSILRSMSATNKAQEAREILDFIDTYWPSENQTSTEGHE